MTGVRDPFVSKVFVCYPRRLVERVERIVSALTDAGYDTFFDRDCLALDEPWERILEEELRGCTDALIIFDDEGCGDYQGHPELKVLETRWAREPEFAPVVLPLCRSDAWMTANGSNFEPLRWLKHLHTELVSPNLQDHEISGHVVRRLSMRHAVPPDARELRILAETTEQLLTWERTLPRGQRLPMVGEEDALKHGLKSDGVLLVLGGPGSGKSALLAELGHRLREHHPQCYVLAIKADRLDRSIGNHQTLADHLGFRRGCCPRRTLAGLVAQKKRVVLLVDQMDVLSDLLDQQTHRLSALLHYLRIAAGIPGVAVIASCRDFDFHHDVRFRVLSQLHERSKWNKNQTLQLAPMDESDVRKLLVERGILHKGATGGNLEVLRTPQHLRTFLEFHDSGHGEHATPELTYHRMLAKLWDVGLHSDVEARDLVNEIACAVADQEDLWVPILDRYERGPLDRAISYGILKKDVDGRPRVSFTHQTLFDFARSRAFVARGESLKDYVVPRQDGLSMRPVLLRALRFLRDADKAKYKKEFAALWQPGVLRPVHRQLLASFLAQVPDPDGEEKRWMLAECRRTAACSLEAVKLNHAWFGLLADSVLPEMMSGSGPPFSIAASVLVVACKHPELHEPALQLLQRHWGEGANHQWAAVWVLWQASRWSEQAVGFAARVLDTVPLVDSEDIPTSIFGQICSGDATTAFPYVTAWLNRELRKIRAGEQSVVENKQTSGTTYFDGDGLRRVFRAQPRLYTKWGIEWIVSAVLAIAKRDNMETSSLWLRFIDDSSPELYSLQSFWGSLPRDALTALVEEDWEYARSLVHDYDTGRQSPLWPIWMRVMAHLARSVPQETIDFLFNDPLNLIRDRYHTGTDEASLLVGRVCEVLDQVQVDALVSRIQRWKGPTDEPFLPWCTAVERGKYVLARRLELLQHIPAEKRGTNLEGWMRNQTQRLGPRYVYDRSNAQTRRFMSIPSRIPLDIVRRAKVRDVVHVFDPKFTKNRRKSFQFPHGDIDLEVMSQEIATDVCESPERALEYIEEALAKPEHQPMLILRGVFDGLARSKATRNVVDRCMDAALPWLCEHPDGPPVLQGVFERQLREKGPRTESCKRVAQALERWFVYGPVVGTREKWLGRAAPDADYKSNQAVLWAPAQSIGVSTDSLVARNLGTYFFDESAKEVPRRWWDMIKARLNGQTDDPQRWDEIAGLHRDWWRYLPQVELEWLVDKLLELYPISTILKALLGVFAGYCNRREALSPRFWEWMDLLAASDIVKAKVVYGELLAFVCITKTGDTESQRRIAQLMSGGCHPVDPNLLPIYVGLAHTATHLWNSSYCDAARTLFFRLAHLYIPDVVGVLVTVVLYVKRPAHDRWTEDLLRWLLDSRVVAATVSKTYHVVRYLSAISDWFPEQVSALVLGMVEQGIRDGSYLTELSMGSREMIDLAYTLTRTEDARAAAMDAIDRLAEAGAPKIRETLVDNDRVLAL